MIRDQALAAAGLLDDRLGGPSVKPYQPEGLWTDMVSLAPEYEQSHGSDLYRRSLYTFLRRTVPPPALNVFDQPTRETCTLRREQTNTPLQALVAMNDPTFIETSRVLAENLVRETGGDNGAWIEAAFLRILARKPSSRERQLLRAELEFQKRQFASDPEREALLAVGEWTAPVGDAADLAARTAVISLLFNLDEALVRE